MNKDCQREQRNTISKELTSRAKIIAETLTKSSKCHSTASSVLFWDTCLFLILRRSLLENVRWILSFWVLWVNRGDSTFLANKISEMSFIRNFQTPQWWLSQVSIQTKCIRTCLESNPWPHAREVSHSILVIVEDYYLLAVTNQPFNKFIYRLAEKTFTTRSLNFFKYSKKFDLEMYFSNRD